jgi:hypothetical protein
VIRLARLQDVLAASGLLTRDQMSLYIQNGKSHYTPEPDEHVFRMTYQAVLWIENFTGELWLLSLILEDTVQEIWPITCTSASVERLDTDPLNTPEANIAYLINATETYRLIPVTEPVDGEICIQLSMGLFRVEPLDIPTQPVNDLPMFRGVMNVKCVPR